MSLRIRIIKPVRGEIDGVSLDHYRVGETYEIGTTLASYLLALGAAVPVSPARAPAGVPADAAAQRAADRLRPRTKKKTHR
jgi:hypothetical protein